MCIEVGIEYYVWLVLMPRQVPGFVRSGRMGKFFNAARGGEM